jgi:hypothetical protein
MADSDEGAEGMFLFFYVTLLLTFSSGLDTVVVTKNAIKHLAKIIETKKALFEVESARRRKMADFERVTVKDLIEWLFHQAGKKEIEYAHTCIELFHQLIGNGWYKNLRNAPHLSKSLT